MQNDIFNLKASRIEVVDALRGYAVMSIMLLHNIEHFDFYHFPEHLPNWMKVLDKGIWETLFFLFGGKSYAIFALLFCFTFFIQNQNQEKKGKDFRLRFAWRLVLLAGFGYINTIFFEGDILVLYAILGGILIVTVKFNNRLVLMLALLLLLLPFDWYVFFDALLTPNYVAPKKMSSIYFKEMMAALKSPSYSFLEHARINLTIGRKACLYWCWENTRFFQASALFLLGMLLGRKGYFIASENSFNFWKKIIFYCIPLTVLLFVLKYNAKYFFESKAIFKIFNIVMTSWSNVTFMFVVVGVLILSFYHSEFMKSLLSKLMPFGKMSLTCYITQSVMGAFVYYRWGLGLYEYTGATYCFLIAIVLFSIQLIFCKCWLKNHKQGPFEYIWSKLTWLSFKSKEKSVII
ncbi:DUF418 domain-containing protein [Flavobacterium ajazii]|uniref:DUF418 domain-containing protein n=1 Tax=Flavobacterium ajazii TaxID=2692318 RepID=UPI0013D7EDDC|nr:DUF418 domain-containing protein [Flavobacterium ajazii]